MAYIKLRTLAAATGPTEAATGLYFVANNNPLTVSEVDYNFLNLNYGKLDKNLNLSDLQSASTARTNLGLGSLAIYNASGATGLGNVGASGIITFGNLATGFVKATSGVLSVDTNTYLTGNQTITVSGVVSGSGSTAITTTFPSNAITGLGTLGSTGVVSFTEGSTGALIVRGGVGVTGNLTVDGTLRGALTGNASSASTATQLTNTRTLWGQSFNGTADVTGALSSVGSIGASGIVSLTNTTASSAYTNGALVVSGGVGITGAVNTNNNITAAGTITAQSNFVLEGSITPNTNLFTIRDETNGNLRFQVDSANGNTVLAGTFGASGAATFGNNVTVNSGTLAANSVSITGGSISGTTISTSNATITGGSIATFGNIGSTGIVTLGGSTGALVVSGGVGIGGNLTVKGYTNLGTRLVLGNTINQQELFLSGAGGSNGAGNNGNLVLSVPESSTAYLTIGGTLAATFNASVTVGLQGNNALAISNPVTGGVFNLPAGSGTYTAATLDGVETLSNKTISGAGNIGASGITTLGGSTGALIVSGGVGIGGNITAVGTANFGNIGSTGITTLGGSTGALVVSGGVGIGKNLTTVGTARFGNIGSTGFATLSNVTIAAGTATTAPLTFTSGTNLTNTIAGSVEYDGTVFYATPSSNFGRVPVSAPMFISGANTATLFDGNSCNIFAGASSGGLTLPVGTYKFEFSINFNITGSTTADALSIDFCKAIGGRAVGSVAFTSTGGVNNTSTITGSTGVVYQTGATGLNVSIQVTPSMNTNPRLYSAYGKGIIRVHTAGKVRPQYSITLTGATGILSADNYMIITPLTSSNTATSTGNWS